MSVLAAAVVRELGIMHLVTGNESYKITSRVVTRVLGRVDEVQVKIGGIQCAMTFMVMDTDGYDVLLGLDFLMKIGAVVDVERGLIHVRHELGTNVEVLPLTMVNLLQRMNADAMRSGTTTFWKDTSANQGSDVQSDQDQKTVEGGDDESISDSDDESDNDEFHDSKSNPLEPSDLDDEFVNVEFEELGFPPCNASPGRLSYWEETEVKRQIDALVDLAQELSEYGDPELSPTELDEEEGYGVKHNYAYIWRDAECLMLIREGVLFDVVDLDESKRIHNYLQALTAEIDDGAGIEDVVAQFLQKVELIGSIHNDILYNVG
ncbi:unnamed protein product [Sphagnum balticum]